MKLGMQVSLGPGHIVLHWDPAPLPQGKEPPNLRPISVVGRGQMAGCIKMPLGRDLGAGLSDIVLDGDTAPPQKGGAVPQFSAHVLWPNN